MTARTIWSAVLSLTIVGVALVGGGTAAGSGVAAATAVSSCQQEKRVDLALDVRRIAGVCLLTNGTATQSARRGRVLRTGRIVDTDTTYGDNVFQTASGKAYCKRGEKVITGGLRIVNVSGLFGGPARTMPGEDGPDLTRPAGWSVVFGSDLGGLARRNFRVVVVCQR